MSDAPTSDVTGEREDDNEGSAIRDACPCHDEQPASYRITGQPDMPVLWLDTHAVSNIADALNNEKDDDESKRNRRVIEKLTELRQDGTIFSFESDQLYEIESSPTRVRRCLDVLSLLSQGARTSYHHVRREQVRVGMEAHLQRQLETAIEWCSAFDGDPFEDHSVAGKFFVRARFEPDDEEIARRRTMYGTIAAEWEKLRQSTRGGSFNDRFTERLNTERLGVFETLSHRINEAIDRTAAPDGDVAGIVAGRYEMFLGPLRDWQSMGGDNLLGMLEFFRCSHHTELPLIDIWSHLAAWRIVGSEPVSPSDVMDIHHISAFMPHCTHMVLDKSMINAV